VSRRRLDAELVRRGLVGTRAEAEEAVRAGHVTVRGAPATKTTTLVAPDEPLAVRSPDPPFVSRGGEKLASALDAFGVDPAGRVALDAGSSTGGFTDCLLQRGASRVIAVDVGRGQLAWGLRTDPRVMVMERTNVRDLRPEDLPATPSVVTADLAFVALRSVTRTLADVAEPLADLVLLIKPQFEAERADVGRGGVVRDPRIWRSAIDAVAEAAREAGAGPLGVAVSTLPGPAGNIEFFLHAVVGGADGSPDVAKAIADAERLAR